MCTLILTSYACVVIDLINKLLPNKEKLKVAFLPTAGDPYEDKFFVENDRKALVDLVMDVIEVDIKLIRQKELEKILNDVDIIFVAGGNVFYLMQEMRNSGFDRIVKDMLEKGKIYIGSSAGSVICSPTIEGFKQFDDPSLAPGLENYNGLDLVDSIIIPHAQKEKYFERIEKTSLAMNKLGYDVIKLTDNQAFVVKGKKGEVISS